MSDEKIISYKGFDKDFKCRGHQYAVGETYTHNGNVAACESGFHACEYPLDVFSYYQPAGSQFAITEQSGVLHRNGDDSKVASSIIKVSAEIGLPGLIKAAIKYTTSRCKPVDPKSPAFNSGARGAASNSGDYGAASNSGARGAASNSGAQGAAMSVGYDGRVKGIDGSALFLVERDEDGKILNVWAGIAGQNDVLADTWYVLKNGQPIEWQEVEE